MAWTENGTGTSEDVKVCVQFGISCFTLLSYHHDRSLIDNLIMISITGLREGSHPGPSRRETVHPEEDIHKVDEFIPSESKDGSRRSLHRLGGRKKAFKAFRNNIR